MITKGKIIRALTVFLAMDATSGDTDSPRILNDKVAFAQPCADFRFRYESDWDSVNAAGVARADRDRLRIRARVGVKFELSDE